MVGAEGFHMSASTSSTASGDERPFSHPTSPPRQPAGREPDTVALQLDFATEAALAAIPVARVATRSAAGRALEASIERYLSDGGLADIARRYRACRQRRALAAGVTA